MAENNPSVARVVLNVVRDTRHFVNTFHATRLDEAELNAADLESIGNVFADWWNNTYNQRCMPNIVGQSVVVTKLDPSDPLQDESILVTGGSYGAGTIEPADATLSVSWRTGLAGRKHRGRFYIFSLSSAYTTSLDTITGGEASLLLGAANDLIVRMAAASKQLVVFHRSDDTFTPIVSALVETNIDSQRKRLPGRGT